MRDKVRQLSAEVNSKKVTCEKVNKELFEKMKKLDWDSKLLFAEIGKLLEKPKVKAVLKT